MLTVGKLGINFCHWSYIRLFYLGDIIGRMAFLISRKVNP
jgi:hypothetical protein